MAKDKADTIILQGTPKFVEGDLSSVAECGQHIVHDGSGSYETGVASSAGVLRVVTEYDLAGKTIDDAYEIGDSVIAHVPSSGDVVQLRLPAGAPVVAVGDLLERDAAGNFVTGTTNPIAEAEEAVDNSAGATSALIAARII